MNDPSTGAPEVVMQFFPPLMIALPLCIAAVTPARSHDDAAVAATRFAMLRLTLFTGLSLVVWIGLVLASFALPGGLLNSPTRATWVLFFPLWFACAMPAIRAKNPVWGAAMHRGTVVEGATRTASLGNRAKENPIGPVAWGFAAFVAAAVFVAIAARGREPFSTDDVGQAEHARWLRILVVHGTVAFSTLLVMAFSVRLMHAEPEPLDPGGSEELVDLYRHHRLRKIHGMFWLLGVVSPAFLGAMMTAMVWWPGDGRTIGLIGGIGGALLGVGGAVFGCRMSAERIRIAEFKARLE